MARAKTKIQDVWSKSFLKKGVGRKPTHGFDVVETKVDLVPTVHVSAAAIFNLEGEVLLAKRPEGKALAGLWEFPGGKLKEGELPETALMRELGEELGIQVSPEHVEPLTFVSCTKSIEGKNLLMYLFKVSRWKGKITALENQKFAWVKVQDLEGYADIMPQADVPMAKILMKMF